MTSDTQNRRAADRPAWGLLPEDIVNALKNQQWQNPKKLKRLLKSDSAFPLRVALKPPRGNAALDDINHFQNFVTAWKSFTKDKNRYACNQNCEVKWQRRSFRSLCEQNIPVHLKIPDIGSLACLLGNHEQHQLKQWQSRIAYIVAALGGVCATNSTASWGKGQASEHNERRLFIALIDHLETLDKFAHPELELLVKLIPQLTPGMGKGCYLRALPVTFVDTKFIENNLRIIESITAALIDETIAEAGLLRWLHCKDKPKKWLLVKPLCKRTTEALGGIALLRLASDTLFEFELPARNILVIENEQSCLALNNIPDTIAVAGGGKNVAWMRAQWLVTKRVAYWGDIDSEGFSILSDARSKLSTITALMMDAVTVETYQARMVSEPDSVSKAPIALTETESDLFKRLRTGQYANTRLEQERLPLDYATKNITCWLG